MDKVFEKIKNLEDIRQLPQFIFIAKFYPSSILKVRQEIQNFIAKNPKSKEIDFILESPGGSADLAYKLIRMLREHFTVNIVVPFWAKSAATLFALGGSTIIMDELGEFGPLDPQLSEDEELPDSEPQSGLVDEYSLTTIENRSIALYQRMLKKLLKKNDDSEEIDIRIKKTILSEQVLCYISKLYKPLFEKINPYQIGEKARSLAVGERYAERILNTYNKENMKEDIEYFVDYMVHECPDHGYIIDYSIMSLFLSNVKKSIEISEAYSNSLAQLSTIFFQHMGQFKFIGFFNDKLLAKMTNINDTTGSASHPKNTKGSKGRNKDEKHKTKK